MSLEIGEAEIGKSCRAVVEDKDIFRAYISVRDVVAVRHFQRLGDIQDDAQFLTLCEGLTL